MMPAVNMQKSWDLADGYVGDRRHIGASGTKSLCFSGGRCIFVAYLLFSMQTVGILGGGQLGRMLIQAGLNWDIRFRVMDPDAHAPCRHLCEQFVQASLMDYDAVLAFGLQVDVLTIEIEAVNVDALEVLERRGVKVYPQPSVIRTIQDKRLQKQFYAAHQLATAPFVLTAGRQDVAAQADFLPAVHKIGQGGYDGRGVQVLRSPADLPLAFEAPSVLEKLVDIHTEIAVIVSRGPSGQRAVFPAVSCVYHPEHNLVDHLLCPAPLSADILAEAEQLALQVADKLGIIGLLAVEMFVDQTGQVLLNECAPRPHNSGHQTIEANVTSQYEQHLRAILDLPMGDTRAVKPSAMLNLLGAPGYQGPVRYEGLADALSIPEVYVHLYGKAHTKPFRKMGHVTILGQDFEELRHKIEYLRPRLHVISHS